MTKQVNLVSFQMWMTDCDKLASALNAYKIVTEIMIHHTVCELTTVSNPAEAYDIALRVQLIPLIVEQLRLQLTTQNNQDENKSTGEYHV